WLLIQEAEHAAEAAEHTPSVFNLEMGTSFWTFVIFFILLAVLAKWAFPPILGYAQAREDRIQESLDEAREAREEAQAALEEQRRELAEAREESQQIIAQGKHDAEKLRQELLNRAKAEQQEIVERAKRDIEREREQALESIRREAVEISLAAASHLLSRNVDAEEDRRLVRDYLGLAEARAGETGAGV
nr:F0F1 ATP synthase subunit B [Gemmatimonadota bacterium]NIW36661.1 F0F1 ATP synthase subunit B [Gemmatimonadota bacterium]NIY12406.1 F0F1 ATP synthase subunit B [Gemmatimonadota bacterium]